MKQFKVTFSVDYGHTFSTPIEHTVFAATVEDLKQIALKVFVNDQIEDETGLLDNAISVNLIRFDHME